MPTISVIVPVYNAEKYLNSCVESILNQTFTDFELILVDDGSSDNCSQMCDNLAKNDSRIIVIHQENQGQAAARNRGIELAGGKWVCFVDSDDIINDMLLEVLYNNAIENNVRISCCDCIEGEAPPKDFFSTKPNKCSCIHINEEVLVDFYKERYLPWIVWAKLIDIDIVRLYPFTEGKFYEDNAVVCKWLVDAKRISYTNAQLYFYAINPVGTTKSSFSLKKLDVLWALSEISFFYKSIGYTRLNEIFIEKYLISAVDFYYKTKSNNYIETALKIKQDIKLIYEKNKAGRFIDKDKRTYVSEIIYPRTMWIYWRFVAIKNRLIRIGGK